MNSEANARRIALVEGCFGTSGQPLGVPGRVLVGEGVLTKACRKKPKPRQFFLFNDLLVYGNIVINKKKYNKQVGLFYILNDVITTQFAAFNSLGRSEIKILGG